jgi:hypothetical protein
MCRETIRKAVVQKFNETKKWNCNDIEELYDKIENRKEANDIVNSIKICDPAVGSGHFLVSALNEMIAVKNDLKILQDRDGKRLKEYQVEVVNDELIVTDEEGELFEYNPTNSSTGSLLRSESQRIQETLFHEKQTIIENSLFGVDINPNSVKICRLRLWIELLKNAYYKNSTELETLPNIDINIKCGNSLVSRFAIDADLSQALKKSKWTIDSYRIAVDTYRNAESKEQKREMERLIADIKSDFRSEISLNDPKAKKQRKLSGELFQITQQTQLFEMNKKEKADWNKKVLQLTGETKKIENEIEEIKANKIFENAFEWRFEFPEVLNDDGDFVGFDVVIGNPPYLVVKGGRYNNGDYSAEAINFIKSNYKTGEQQINTYTLFLELSNYITSSIGFTTLIIPNTFLANEYSLELRKFILENFGISEIYNAGSVFEDASVETVIIALSKEVFLNKTKITNNGKSYFIDLVENSSFTEDKKFLILITPEIATIIEKLNLNGRIKEYAKVWRGLTTGNDKKYISGLKTEKEHKPLITGSDISRYCNLVNKKYVLYRPAELDRARDQRIFLLQEKLVSKFVGDRLCFTIDINQFYVLNSACVTEVLTEKTSIKYLLGILNSKLINFYFTNVFTDYRDSFPLMKSGNIESLPLKLAPIKIETEIKTIVDQILIMKLQDSSADTTALETQIDQLVYKLYDLTEEEIKIIEGI